MTFSGRVPLLSEFERIVFFTGAGMSAESGVPTYRGKGGIWKQYDWQSYACQAAFDAEPGRVWDFHNYRRSIVGACKPNPGHELIARTERLRPEVTVVTQNIDGLHQLAGSKNVVELHGSLWRLRCDACGWRAEDRSLHVEELRCTCGAWKRPDIVWFADALSPVTIESAVDAISRAECLVSIGTSAVVYPAAQLPLLAKRAGATLIEINPEETPMSASFDHHLRGTATEMLTQLTRTLA